MGYPKGKTFPKILNFAETEEMKAMLQETARQKGASLSEILREAVRKYLSSNTIV